MIATVDTVVEFIDNLSNTEIIAVDTRMTTDVESMRLD